MHRFDNTAIEGKRERLREETGLAVESREETMKPGDMTLSRDSASEVDKLLVKEIIAGNDAAFAELVARYKDSITN
jgi:hypothetical protein